MHRPIVVTIWFLAVLAAMTVPIPPSIAAGTVPIAPDSIAFTDIQGASDVYLIEVGTSTVDNLTNDADSNHSPTWSPTGSHLAFVTHQDGAESLHVLRPTGVVAIASGASDWSWSPDGTAIAWTSRGTVKDLWVTDVTSGVSSNLTNGALEARALSWSPNSAVIAFESPGQGGAGDIFAIPNGGGSPINLTQSPDGESSPAWSPDGAKIAFVSYRDGDDAIYTMNADGSDPVLLVSDPETACSGTLGSLAWSPSGSRLAYRADTCGSPVLHNVAFFVVDRTGGTPTLLAGGLGGYHASGPIWSPDGGRLAMVAGGSSDWSVIVAGVDGRDRITMNDFFGCSRGPSWAPDASRLSFVVPSNCGQQVSPPPQPTDLYVVDLDAGTVPTWLINGDEPAWRPHEAYATDFVVLGGADAVSDAVTSWLATCTNGAISRVAGANRYATSAALSAVYFEPGTDVVYVATGEKFPDALAGSAAAGADVGGPVLLVAPDWIPAETTAELVRLQPKLIVVLGGTSAISTRVETALGAYGSVVRVAGPDRYATGALASAYAFPSADTAYVATGVNFPEALASGPAAVIAKGPVLLVEPNAIPASVRDELARLGLTDIVLVGGTAAVSATVEAALNAYATTVTRIAGPDRYATAVAISQATITPWTDTIFVATGHDFPDALAGGSIAGALGAPILLVEPNSIPASTETEIERLTGGTCAAEAPSG